MKFELVRFRNNKFGVRKKGSLGWKYKDFASDEYWWSIKSRHFKDCLTSFAVADKYYSSCKYKSFWTRVKEFFNPPSEDEVYGIEVMSKPKNEATIQTLIEEDVK